VSSRVRAFYGGETMITVSRTSRGHVRIYYTSFLGDVTQESLADFKARERRDSFVRTLIDQLSKATT
jgi:hypothetical protein